MDTSNNHKSHAGLWALIIGAIGVVYGDIGTSPLYAVNEIFFGHGGLPRTEENALQAISLIFWCLTLLISVNYIALVLQADHHGEGGVFALLALIGGRKGLMYRGLIGLLMLAAGLLYGDGLITPAISVLSAVEGLKVATPAFEPYVVPITIVILTCLFVPQYLGTGKVGMVFGPIVVVWFIVIAVLGVVQVAQHPGILWAVNPVHAIRFFISHEWHTVLTVLGSVMLAVTGGEALFADLGHFGRKPIRIGWLALVYPALLCNYFGQGAYIMSGQEVFSENIFYSLVPSVLLYPMVALATAATVIASQALITGAFSLTSQATALGLLPRFLTVHTSRDHSGQIYLPAVNWGLYVGCVTLVLFFRSSTNLAAAYGLAVSGVMCVTSLAMMTIAIDNWRWKVWHSVAVFGGFGAINFLFFVANSLKFFHGGYVPLLMGLAIFLVMAVWQWGRGALAQAYSAFNGKTIEWLVSLRVMLNERQEAMSEGLDYAAQLVSGPRRLVEIDRAAVFLISRPVRSTDDRVPAVVRIVLKKYGALPRSIVLFNVSMEPVAEVPDAERFEVITLGPNVTSVIARYGYMEKVDIRGALARLQAQERISIPAERWIIEIGQEAILIEKDVPFLRYLQIRLFTFLSRITTPAHVFFGLGMDAGVSAELVPIRFGATSAVVAMPELETTVAHTTTTVS